MATFGVTYQDIQTETGLTLTTTSRPTQASVTAWIASEGDDISCVLLGRGMDVSSWTSTTNGYATAQRYVIASVSARTLATYEGNRAQTSPQRQSLVDEAAKIYNRPPAAWGASRPPSVRTAVTYPTAATAATMAAPSVISGITESGQT